MDKQQLLKAFELQIINQDECEGACVICEYLEICDTLEQMFEQKLDDEEWERENEEWEDE